MEPWERHLVPRWHPAYIVHCPQILKGAVHIYLEKNKTGACQRLRNPKHVDTLRHYSPHERNLRHRSLLEDLAGSERGYSPATVGSGTTKIPVISLWSCSWTNQLKQNKVISTKTEVRLFGVRFNLKCDITRKSKPQHNSKHKAKSSRKKAGISKVMWVSAAEWPRNSSLHLLEVVVVVLTLAARSANIADGFQTI